MQYSRLLIAAACILFLGSLGCGRADDGRVEVYPVSGKVLVNGQPAAGAEVVFYPQSAELSGPGMPVPEGVTDDAGKYELTSYEPSDGAPAGEFKVTVFWPETPPPNFTGIFDPKDRLRGKYSNPDTTKLTATVPEGGGEIPPFEVQ